MTQKHARKRTRGGVRPNLNFEELIPEAPTFTDEDGTKYSWRTPVEFGPVDMARLQGYQRAMSKGMDDLLEEDQVNEDMAQEIEQLARHFVALILPDLPDDRLKGLKFGQLVQMVRWWTTNTDFDDELGEAS